MQNGLEIRGIIRKRESILSEQYFQGKSDTIFFEILVISRYAPG